MEMKKEVSKTIRIILISSALAFNSFGSEPVKTSDDKSKKQQDEMLYSVKKDYEIEKEYEVKKDIPYLSEELKKQQDEKPKKESEKSPESKKVQIEYKVSEFTPYNFRISKCINNKLEDYPIFECDSRFKRCFLLENGVLLWDKNFSPNKRASVDYIWAGFCRQHNGKDSKRCEDIFKEPNKIFEAYKQIMGVKEVYKSWLKWKNSFEF